jgi:hypothetical protein
MGTNISIFTPGKRDEKTERKQQGQQDGCWAANS